MAFPFYGADGTSGTVAATNGSKTVTGTGTNWLSNNAIPSAGGYCIKMPDAKIYGIDTCTGEGALALSENYAGSNVSGGSYYIIPTAASNAALLNQVSTLLNSSNFSQIAGLSPNSGDFPEYLSGTWATRSPTQVILNLLNSVGEVSIASASTCDIGAATTPKVQITGTTTITGFGAQANAVRLVRFGGALTLTHNATSLILLGGASRTTASGDVGIYVSDSSGHWREWSFRRASNSDEMQGYGLAVLTADDMVMQRKSGAVAGRTMSQLITDLVQTGSWAPTDASGVGLTFTSISAEYIKIGPLVIAMARFTIPSTASGVATNFDGLPFTVSNNGYNQQGFLALGNATAQSLLATINDTKFSLFTSSGGTVAWSQVSATSIRATLIYFT